MTVSKNKVNIVFTYLLSYYYLTKLEL